MNDQPNPPEMVRCGSCKGKGHVEALANFSPFGKPRRIPCIECDGEGHVSMERQAWLARGKIHRNQRLERGESIGTAARRLGLDINTLLDLERGRRPNSHLVIHDTGDKAA